jgi:hypothetical protein
MSDDTTDREQLRGMVGTVLAADLRDQFVEYARLDAFRDEAGELDTEKVMGHLTAIHLATQRRQQQSQPNYGQATGHPAAANPGDTGRAALHKRHGVTQENGNPQPAQAIQPGKDGRSALERRHGVKK